MTDIIVHGRDLTKLYNEANKLTPNGRVRLIHVNAQDIDPGDGAIGGGHHYFHYHAVPHTAAEIDAANGDETKLGPKSLFLGGQQYDFWPCAISDLVLNTEQNPTPSLQVYDVQGVITRLCLNYADIIGATVNIIDTFANFLDDGSDADPSQYQIQSFNINAVTGRQPGRVVTFQLASPADLQGQYVPRRQYLNICTWAIEGKYGSGDGCTWDRTATGIKYFDENGNEVQNISLDRCGGCLSDCKKRFGQGYTEPAKAPLDFGGFPGAHLINVR